MEPIGSVALQGESPGLRSVRELAWKYLLLQGILVLAWWSALWFEPGVRTVFVPVGMPETVLIAFALPDLALLAAGSVAAACLLRLRSEMAPAAAWLTTGFSAYASLLCLSLSLLTDSAWAGPLLMLPSTLLTSALTMAATPPRREIFRVARPASAVRNVRATGVQVVLFWGTLLFLVPGALAEMDARLGLPVLSAPGGRAAAGAAFLAFSAVGLWSGLVMSTRGQGTPLPLDGPRRMVVSGPYAYIRNPMATAGLGQGAAVALWLGSPVVMAYVMLGSLLWQCLARPLEEDDLEARFGDEFRAYRAAVPCWLPRLAPYRNASPAVASEPAAR